MPVKLDQDKEVPEAKVTLDGSADG